MSREIASGDIPTSTDPESLYFLGQSAPGQPAQKILGSNLYGRATPLGVASPEGVVSAPEGSIARGNDGALWHKETGGDGNTGWRRIVVLNSAGDLELSIKFTSDSDPGLPANILTMADDQLFLSDGTSRRGLLQSGARVDRLFIANGHIGAANKAIPFGQSLALTAGFMDSFYVADNTNNAHGELRVFLEYELFCRTADTKTWYVGLIGRLDGDAYTSYSSSAHFTHCAAIAMSNGAGAWSKGIVTYALRQSGGLRSHAIRQSDSGFHVLNQAAASTDPAHNIFQGVFNPTNTAPMDAANLGGVVAAGDLRLQPCLFSPSVAPAADHQFLLKSRIVVAEAGFQSRAAPAFY